MHTADARLFESCGEAAGAATVEADYVDAPGGGKSRCVDAYRFTDRYRLGHGAMRVELQSLKDLDSLRECHDDVKAQLLHDHHPNGKWFRACWSKECSE